MVEDQKDYYEFEIRIDYGRTIHEESYFFKQTFNEDKKPNGLELIAKEDTSLFTKTPIEDYKFTKKSKNRYVLRLLINKEKNEFLFKIDNKNRKIEVTPEHFKPKIHAHLDRISEDAYWKIEFHLEKDVKDHIFPRKSKKI